MMRRRHPAHSYRRALPLFLGLLFAAPAFAAPPEGAEESARADEYFRQGKAFVKEDRWEDARRAYLAGYRLKRGYDIAGNLGNVELELGMAKEAAEHLAYCIKSFPATGTAAQLAYVKGRFEEARQKVAALAIQVNLDGAEVFVDGRSIGRSPFVDDVYVEPGTRTLEAKLAGFALAKRVIEASKGSFQSVALALRADARGSAGHGPTPPPVERSRAPLYLGTGAALLGAGAGVATALLSQTSATRAATQFDRLKSAGGLGACLDPANKQQCDALDGAYRDRAMYRTLSIAGFATAGAGLVTILVYAVVPGDKPRTSGASAPRFDVAAGPGMTGLLVTGGF